MYVCLYVGKSSNEFVGNSEACRDGSVGRGWEWQGDWRVMERGLEGELWEGYWKGTRGRAVEGLREGDWRGSYRRVMGRGLEG